MRAKVASGGLSGFWLMPSEEHPLGYTPCARVAIAEVCMCAGEDWFFCKPQNNGSRPQYRCFLLARVPMKRQYPRCTA